MDILTACHVSYTYTSGSAAVSKPAVNDVSFSLAEGSYTAFTGENGSGKSTLARILCGLLVPDIGTVSVKKGARVCLVFQSPKDQIVCGIVWRDTAFGPQNLNLTPSEVELRTIESLGVTGMIDKADCQTMALSLGQTQKTAVSGIIALQPDVLILDEAVSMLDPASREDVFTFLKFWNRTGHTIVHITHDSDAVRESSHVFAFHGGSLIFSGTSESFFSDGALCRKISGAELPRSAGKTDNGTPYVFAVENASCSYGAHQVLRSVSFGLTKGSLTALTGVSGSGKSTLLELCAGLIVPDAGAVRAEIRPVLAQQNSDASLFEQFAADDVAFGLRNSGVSGTALVTQVKEAMDMALVPFSVYAERRTYLLSGGEKRRLSIAGIIALGTPVVLLDEPTAGLDGPARYEMMQMLRHLAESGRTVLFSTHRRDEALFADRELAIVEGTFSGSPYIASRAAQVPPVPPLAGTKMLESLRRTAEFVSSADETSSSPVGRLPSVCKHLLFLLLFIASLAVRPVWLCALMFAFSLVYAFCSGYPKKRLASSLVKIIPLLLFFCIFQMIFYPVVPGERVYVSLRYFMVTPTKILLCLKTLFHTEAALACIVSFVYTTSEYELVDGFSLLFRPLTVLHVPVRYAVVVIQMIFRFVPLLIDEAQSITKTQLVRGGLRKTKGGVARFRALLPLFIPLIIQTIRRSEALADAITERSFS